jgi:predicted permease
MLRDFEYGLRRLASQKLFSLSVILLLAIGIGSNTVIFSFVNSLLLKPLPVRNPANLYLVQQQRERQVRPETGFFYRQFQTIQQHNRIFCAAVAEQAWADNSFQALQLADSVHVVSAQMVSPNYFVELGVKAIAGRVLDETDAQASASVPVVISEQCWNTQFRRDPHILNRIIRIRNVPFVVVGVLPAAFHGIDADRVPDVRLPISAAPLLTGNSVTEPRGDHELQFQILARLAPRIAATAAAGVMTPVLTGMEEQLWRAWYARSSKPYPPSELTEVIAYGRSYRVSLLSAARGVSRLREQFSQAVVLLMGAVGLLLLVVCGNLAGLMLAKAESRQREIGVRLSLGASRWRIVRQLYAETVWLALPGTALAVVFALLVTPLLLRFLPVLGVGAYSPPIALDVQLDLRVFYFAAAAGLLAMSVFGLAPALRVWRNDLNLQLVSHSRSVSPVSASGVVGFQVALTVLLLTASLLISRTFWSLNHLNPGFDQDHVIEATLDPWNAGLTDSQATALLTHIKQRVSQLPGARSVSYAGAQLMRGIGSKTTVVPAGRQLSSKTFLNTSLNRVTPDYFESLGIPLLSGRNLDVRDIGVHPERIVVNRAFADYFFPGQNPIGKAVIQGVDGSKPPTAVIVGMVGTAKYRSLRELDPPTYYSVSDIQHVGGVMYVRTHGDPAPVMRAIQRILRELAPSVPLATIYTLRQEAEASLWQERLVTLLCAFFGLSALALSAIGIYSALAYSVGRRLRELGIRMAVGAQSLDIVRTVSAGLAVAVLLGVMSGLAASALLLKSIKSLLFQIDPFDIPSFSLAAVILLGSGAIAAAIPAWRAIKIEPAIALRQE